MGENPCNCGYPLCDRLWFLISQPLPSPEVLSLLAREWWGIFSYMMFEKASRTLGRRARRKLGALAAQAATRRWNWRGEVPDA